MEKYYKRWFLILACPAVLLFLLVIMIPFLTGVIYSFTGWRGTYFVQLVGGNPQRVDGFWEAFVGLKNYVLAFKSSEFRNAFLYTLKFTLVAVIVINIVSLSLALLLSKIQRFAGVFRAIYFLPNLLGGLALGFIWGFVFEIVFSQILFGSGGLISIPFLTHMTQDNLKALFALVILATWQMAGYMLLIYINGLNNVPSDIYEAAKIDGSNGTNTFFKITLPMLMPSITIVFFLTLANCFKLLDQNVALTDGNFGTRLLSLQILQTTQDTVPPNYGLAQAQAVIFFVLIAVVALIQLSITKKREVEV
ncbi:carbohydrate ABC transporter permease [Paenibacillus phocaensis]|uniref:carbohydrate ABC transporter permease n=1 Tax=Paenibacillus phocaensis TaxID=1776378 RepID=UPI000839D759|nr:sugar ABC transporter permease [Paenibacillus phocaensis]